MVGLGSIRVSTELIAVILEVRGEVRVSMPQDRTRAGNLIRTGHQTPVSQPLRPVP